MPYFRKKPVVIEAVQLTGSSVSLREVYKFIKGEYPDTKSQIADERWEDYVALVNKEGCKIETPEGFITASVGDWIVKGYTESLGFHFWPVKPDYFEQNYEAVDKPE